MKTKLDYILLDNLKRSGNWFVRTDTNEKSYGDFGKFSKMNFLIYCASANRPMAYLFCLLLRFYADIPV